MFGVLGWLVCLTDKNMTDPRFIDIFGKYLYFCDVVLFFMKGGGTWFVAFNERRGLQIPTSE
jgi:hypothetical protein